jgi:hypothetical protein
MDRNLEELLSALNAHNVRYVVVGGYALAVHAQPRATKDLDVFIDRRPEHTVGGFRARYISAEHLIANKLASGRPQDLADVAAVRQAQAANKKSESDS